MESHDLDRLTDAYKRGDLTAEELKRLVGDGAERNVGTSAGRQVDPLTIAGIVAAVTIIVGPFLPWASVLGLTVTGWHTDLKLQIGLITAGGVISLAFLARRTWARVLAVLAAGMSLGISGYYVVKMLQGTDQRFFHKTIHFSVNPGIGLWLMFGGSLAAVAIHAWGLRTDPVGFAD